MKQVRRIVDKNPNIDFVVMTKNQKEVEGLRDILCELGYEPSIPLAPLAEMMMDVAHDCDFKCGWRISKTRGIAWNPSQKHWEQYYADILEINQEGKLSFVERKCTL